MSVANNTKNIERLADALKGEREKTQNNAIEIRELKQAIATLSNQFNQLEQNMLVLGVANNFDSGPTA